MEQFRSGAIQRQIDAFLQGFRELIPPSLLIFNEQELELLLCGLPSIDLHDLQAHIEYRGYTAKDEVISWFWAIGATYLTQIPVFTKEVLAANERVVTLFNGLFTVGIGLGALCAPMMTLMPCLRNRSTV